jgi:hypothetical protein
MLVWSATAPRARKHDTPGAAFSTAALDADRAA